MKYEISKKIIADHGTLVCYCRKNGINVNTFKQVLYGNAKSKPIAELLKRHKYIKNLNEIGKN